MVAKFDKEVISRSLIQTWVSSTNTDNIFTPKVEHKDSAMVQPMSVFKGI